MTTGEKNDLEKEWREGVNVALKDLGKQAGQTAMALEKTVGAVTALEARMTHQESQPATIRSNWQLILMGGGCLASLLGVCVALAGSVIVPLAIFYFSHH